MDSEFMKYLKNLLGADDVFCHFEYLEFRRTRYDGNVQPIVRVSYDQYSAHEALHVKKEEFIERLCI